MKIRLNLQEVASGVTKKFKVHKNVTCPECQGSGCEKGHDPETCPNCNGTGYVLRSQRSMFGMMQSQEPCPNCHGEGVIVKHKCAHCHGEGIIEGDEIVEITIPAGVESGMVLNVRGKGHAARRGGVPGDIQVLIDEEPNKDFIRDGSDLIYNLLLTVPQACLGDSVEIPTIDGKARIKITPGTQPGTALRLRGKGLPDVNGYGKGDIVVNISIYIPETLNSQDRKAMEQLAQSDHIRPDQKVKESIFRKFRNYFS